MSSCAPLRSLGRQSTPARFPAVPYPIPEPRESGFTATTPVPLYWARYGPPGESPLVVLHGGPGADHRYLLPQMLHLAEEHDTIFYDQRGSGHSRATNNDPITWRDHVADLSAICRQFGLENPVIVGYSWGGLLAMLYAIAALDDSTLAQPTRLALVSPAPVTTAYRKQFDEALRARSMTPAITGEREALMASGERERDPEAYRQRMFELGVMGYFADPADAHDITPFRVVGRVQQSTWDSLGDFDIRPELERLSLPALIVHGRDDPIPAASSSDVARALEGDLVVIEDCGHVPFVERPYELWRALDPFLSSSDRTA